MTLDLIQCGSCGFEENSVRARFCGMCAQPLPQVCHVCGALNPRGFRFCSQCTSPLSQSIGSVSTRRVVTVLFADVCNSTALTSEFGAERMYAMLDPCLRRLGETVQRFEGTVDKIMGDGIMAVFGIPLALEQHAPQAAYAALAMFDELQRYNEQLQEREHISIQLRIGLASGDVVAGKLGSDRASDATVIGDVVNLAARLQQAAQPNAILLNESSYQLTDSLFSLDLLAPVELKGYSAPIPVWQLQGKRDELGLATSMGGLRTPMVGRRKELDQMLATTKLLEQSTGGIIFLKGEAGVGKSRLTNELLEALEPQNIAVYEGDCATTTRIVPYSAFMGVLRDMADLLPSDNVEVAHTKLSAMVHACGISETESVVPFLEYVLSIDRDSEDSLKRIRHFDPAELKQQVFRSFRQVFLAQSQQYPMMIMLDDLQWADSISLELIDFLTELIDIAPIMFYLIARNEIVEAVEQLRTKLLAKAGDRGLEVALKRLSRRDLQRMVRTLVPYASDAVVQQFAQYADGVPFYLEELVRHALEVGVDFRTRDAEVLQVNRVPMSLEALLRARYDRLAQNLQSTLALAATVGRRFSLTLLQNLDPSDDLKQRLDQLREYALIRPRRSVPGEWTFFHLLMQETVYKSLLLEQRQALHARIGQTIEMVAGERLAEQIETLAFHYSRSLQVDQAIKYNLLAAERAMERYANDDGLRYYALVEVLTKEDPSLYETERIRLYTGRAQILTMQGRYAEARENGTIGLMLVESLDKPEGLLKANLQRQLARIEEKQGRYQQALDWLEQARFGLDDESLIEHAHLDTEAGWVAFLQGDLHESERLLEAALTMAEIHEHIGLQIRVLNRLAGVAWRRGNLDHAGDLVARSLEMSRKINDLAAVARALNNLGIIAADQARWQASESFYTQSMQAYMSIGDVGGQIQTTTNQANPLMMLGKLSEALNSLQQSYALAQRIGDPLHMAFSLINQGRISYFARDLDQARRSFISAESIYRSIGGNQHSRSDTAEHLARIAWLQAKPLTAWMLCERAERLASHTNQSIDMFRAQRLKAFLLAQQGQLDESMKLVKNLEASTHISDTELAWLALVKADIMRLQDKKRSAKTAEKKAEKLFDATRVAPVLRSFI